jgi:hypothetical protein
MLGNKEFWDGGLAYNNPTIAVWFEKDAIFDRGVPVTCVISLGTGKRVRQSRKPLHPHVGAGRQVAKAVLNTQNTHEIFEDSMKAQDVPYHRFNPGIGTNKIGMADWKKLDRLEDYTREYLLHPDIQLKIAKCAALLCNAYNENYK